ncbi:MAG TPA: hypothetical protein EYN91_08815 [Candidatus Melainabacteria bacterium]|nr:hypothetical protein [Candidatus Melainabacteria bacterium]HIN65523.1 hypothetical protein [Candidatus Obscuribacterales bacterium]
MVAVTVCGFLLGGGWRIILDYSEWHSEIFMHANGVEEYLSLLNWLASGPAVGALIGAIAGWGLVYAFGKSKPEISS